VAEIVVKGSDVDVVVCITGYNSPGSQVPWRLNFVCWHLNLLVLIKELD